MSETLATSLEVINAVQSWQSVALSFIVLSLVSVILRFTFRKIRAKAEVGWDGYLILPALISELALCIVSLSASNCSLEISDCIPLHAPP